MRTDSPDSIDTLDARLDSYQTVAKLRARSTNDENQAPAWGRFAAAAGAALIAADDADAAITHVVPPSPISVSLATTAQQTANIDLDGIPGDDLVVRIGFVNPTPYNPYFSYRILGLAYGVNNVRVVGDDYQLSVPYSINYGVERFPAGAVIPAETPSLSGAMLELSVGNSTGLYSLRGNWSAFYGTDTGYAGFVKQAGGSRFAGWIKIRTAPENVGDRRLFEISVLEWAFENSPGVPIEAGQIGSPGLPGDYNNNGVVDAADYTIWRDRLGQNFQLDNENPDDPNPGVVDEGDYAFWKSQFGNTAGSGAGSLTAAVPEPSTITLSVLALGAAGVAALRRRSNQPS